MAVKYNVCASSVPMLIDTSSTKEKKRISSKRCKSYYYICLGALVHTIHKQIENKYKQNDYLYSISSKYAKDLYKWVYQDRKELFVNDFFKSFITSIALFAAGVKLASELVAWRVF